MAATIARGAGRKVALTLSGSFCVHHDRDEFKALICDYLDILFTNESEIEALYGSSDVAAAAADRAPAKSESRSTESHEDGLQAI